MPKPRIAPSPSTTTPCLTRLGSAPPSRVPRKSKSTPPSSSTSKEIFRGNELRPDAPSPSRPIAAYCAQSAPVPRRHRPSGKAGSPSSPRKLPPPPARQLSDSEDPCVRLRSRLRLCRNLHLPSLHPQEKRQQAP